MAKDTALKITNVLLRFLRLCSACIVVGTVGWAIHRIHDSNGSVSGRLIYAEVVAAISIVVSLLLVPPMDYVFMMWPLDAISFIMWVVAFGILADLTGGRTNVCNSLWYIGYWSWY
ncbi:hypothetical protein Q7P35_006816 [Cladosporium inversicolor]